VKGALRFRARIGIRGINPYILVSARRAAQLQDGWRRPLPVRVQINEQPRIPWRINMMPVGDGSFYLYLHGRVRTSSGTEVGDVVRVALAFDHEYRGGPVHAMPTAFRAGLRTNPRARRQWQALSPSRQKEILRYFNGLKSDAARQRNVERALWVLGGGKGRFMARSWNETG
jgi:hypothetical protein